MKQILCDLCHKNDGQTLMLWASHRMGMEDSKNSKYEYFDICLSCLVEKIQYLFENLPLEVNQAFIKILKDTDKKVIKIQRRIK